MEMQFLPASSDRTQLPAILIRHRANQLSWNLSFYKRTFPYMGSPNPPIELINAYWATLPMQHQDDIFASYAQIWSTLNTCDVRMEARMLMNDNNSPGLIFDDLRREIETLYFFHVRNRGATTELSFRLWLEQRDLLPTDPQEADLMALSLALKPMIPIWGTWTHLTRVETGLDGMEFIAYLLLGRTSLPQCEAMQRFRQYISQVLEAEYPQIASGGVIRPMPEHSAVNWAERLLVVRRLSVTKPLPQERNTSLRQFVHSYLLHRLNWIAENAAA